MSLETVSVEPEADELDALQMTGTAAAGEYRCATCRYGIAINALLPTCPMCGGEAWELVARRPLAGFAGLDA
jgi:hypothetical protein